MVSLTPDNQLFLHIPKESLANGNLRISPQTVILPVLNGSYFLAINTLSNAIDIFDLQLVKHFSNNTLTSIDDELIALLYSHGHLVNKSTYQLINNYGNNDLNSKQKLAVIGLCPSYRCNFRCSYCYQHGDDHQLTSNESPDYLPLLKSKVESFITEYKNDYNNNIYIELFGGEPLLPGNEHFFDFAIQLCEKHDAKLIITTNGFHIEDYLDRLLINSKLIAKVSTTLDGVGIEHDQHRRPPAGVTAGDGFKKIVAGINYCLGLGIATHVEMNVDQINQPWIRNLYEFCKEQEWFESHLFSFGVARVDDRMFTGRRRILSETETLRAVYDQFSNEKLPKGFRIEFLKSIYYIAKTFGIHYRQIEYGRDLFNYCWASSKVLFGVYYDLMGNSFRCTYTVGNPDFSLGNDIVGLSNQNGWQPEGLLRNKECLECPIAGYCGGACAISQKVDRLRSCQEEKDSFFSFFTQFSELIDKRVGQAIDSG